MDLGGTVVIKYGGSITKDNEATDAFMEDAATLRNAGVKVVIVHGGGPDINRMLDRLNIAGEFVKGLRKTDEAAMEVVEMVLSGRVNKELTSKLIGKGVDAVGISGRDGKLLEAERMYLNENGSKIDIGFVGEVTKVNGKILTDLLSLGYVPVISPVAEDKEGKAYNINADYAAAAIGASIGADSLVYLSDVDGLFGDIGDPDSLISSITAAEIEKLVQAGAISGGMIPKMKCCIEAIEKGVKSVCLIGGKKPHILLELFHGKEAGTIIIGGEKMSKEKILKTYARFDVTAVRGKGCLIYDINGKEYVDFVSGVAVNCLGHCHPAIINAIREQSCKLMHVSNLYWNELQMELADRLCELSGLEGAFFCNSGTEAVEAAIKFARKYGKLKGGALKHEIIYLNNSFHGRTLGALSVTGQEKYQKDYMPLIPGVKSVDLNDADKLRTEMNSNVCAIIAEPVQGEGGIMAADKSFLEEAKKLCEKYDSLLIFDEVQCGIGRLGSLFAFEKFGVKPDLVCIAKGLGGGFPIGAVVASGKAAECIAYGDHGSTFGGNPLACKVALTILDELLQNGVLENVEHMSKYFVGKLQALKEKHGSIKSIRGIGLLLGLQLSIDTKKFIDQCIDSGLLLVGAGADVVRLLPPLNIQEEYIDRAVDIIDSVLSK